MTDQSGAFPEQGLRILRDPAREFWPGVLVAGLGIRIEVIAGVPGNFADSNALAERLLAALERPRPAPPEPSEEAKRAAEKAYWEASQRSDARRSAEVPLHVALEAAYAVDFGGSAGTGAAPTDTVESLVTWLNANDWWDFSTVELATRILKRLRGGAAQPPPSAPDTEVIREALDCEFRRIGIHHPLEILHRVACCAADALQRVANPDLVRFGVPREETNHE